MTDTTSTLPESADHITIDAENVLHATEREARHGLSHLEDEFLAEWRKMATFSETEAKKLLAWMASKV